MSDQMDGSWYSGKTYAAGRTLLSRTGHSPGPTLMPTPVQTIPCRLSGPCGSAVWQVPL